MTEASTDLPPPEFDAVPESLQLQLEVSDPECVAMLAAAPPGGAREQLALRALRIGLLALRQARGQVDAEAVRGEGERLLAALQHHLQGHRESVQTSLEQVLKEYFDPQSGRFPERVKRLVEQDGELERLLQRQVGGENSVLERTLQAHVGESSRLMRVLSPKESEGILHALQEVQQEALTSQRDRILREFSLDNPEGALARLVRELGERHGDLRKDFQSQLEGVVREFSLDHEDSALSRLVVRVERAQRQISTELSLDEKESALARMQRQLLGVLEEDRARDSAFRAQVMEALGEMRGREQAVERSPEHGLDFEDELFGRVQTASQPAGEVATATGATTGLIPNCKVGDVVLELGAESAAAGAKVVIEAKEKQGYTLAKAREEIETARKNRGAAVGLFVFSRKSAPAGLVPFQRLGSDLFVVWDARDPVTDVWLEAGLAVARALCTRGAGEREAQPVDFEQIDRSILTIEKQSTALGDIDTSAKTIASASEKIRDRVRIAQDAFARQVAALRGMIKDLKES